MDILKMLEELEEEIESSSRVPMTGKVIIESEEILDILDKIRSVLPEEIRQAQWVTKERERMIEEAKKEAEDIIAQAHKKVEQMADESEVAREANERAKKIVDDASEKAEEIKQGADNYAFEVLRDLEDTLSKAITVVQKGQTQLKSKEIQHKEES